MARRSRTRRVLKWLATIACAPLVVLYATSLCVKVAPNLGLVERSLWAEYGHLCVFYVRREGDPTEIRNAESRVREHWASHSPPRLPVFSAIKVSDWTTVLLNTFRLPIIDSENGWTGSTFPEPIRVILVRIYVPLGLPLLALFAMVIVLWWLDRRRVLPGRCQKCGYDLTGNVSGRCPECGREVKASEVATVEQR